MHIVNIYLSTNITEEYYLFVTLACTPKVKIQYKWKTYRCISPDCWKFKEETISRFLKYIRNRDLELGI